MRRFAVRAVAYLGDWSRFCAWLLYMPGVKWNKQSYIKHCWYCREYWADYYGLFPTKWHHQVWGQVQQPTSDPCKLNMPSQRGKDLCSFICSNLYCNAEFPHLLLPESCFGDLRCLRAMQVRFGEDLETIFYKGEVVLTVCPQDLLLALKRSVRDPRPANLLIS